MVSDYPYPERILSISFEEPSRSSNNKLGLEFVLPYISVNVPL